jgi:hypothetical protein
MGCTLTRIVLNISPLLPLLLPLFLLLAAFTRGMQAA